MVVSKRSSAAMAALVLTAVAALILMPRLNEATSRAISQGIRDIRGRFEGALGLTVSFDSLSPSILRSASFSRLAISAPGGRTLLSARRVSASYDILAAIAGRSSEILTGLNLEDVTVDIRLPEDKAVWDRLGALIGGGGGGGGLPKIAITGSNVSASVAIEGFGTVSFDARDAGFSTAREEPAVSLQGRFSFVPSAGGLGTIAGPLSLSGSLTRDFRKARLALAVAADSREFSLSTQRFELVFGDGLLSLTKVKDRAPLDAEVRVDFLGGESSVDLRLDGFAPSKSLRLSGRFASLEPWLEIPYKGSLALKAPGFDLSRLGYDLRLSGSLPASLFRGGSQAVRAEILARGDASAVSVERASVQRGPDRLEYSGSFRFDDLSPDGVLAVDLSLKDGTLGVASSVRLFGHKGEYSASADQATIGGVVFKDLALAAARKGDQADFTLSFRPPASAAAEAIGSDAPAPDAIAPDAAGARFSGEAGAESGLSLLRCEGSVDMGDSPSLELSVDLETIDLGPLKPLLAVIADSPEAASILASLKLGGALFVTSDFKRLSWTAPDLTVVSSAAAGGYALLSLSGTAKTLAVKHALVSASGYTVEGSGKIDFSEAGKLGFEANLALKDIPYSMKGVVVGQGVSITGDYGLELTARAVGADTYVSAKSRDLPLPLGGGLFLATVEAEGRFATLADWEMTVAALDLVPTGESVAVLPKISLAGGFGPASAELRALRIADKFSALEGKASLAYSLSKPLSARLSAALAASGGGPGSGKAPASGESYAVDASYTGGKIEARVDLVASPLARFGKSPVAGSVDGRVSVKGDIGNPSADFSLKLRDGRYLDQTLALGGSGSYGSGVLALRDVVAAYQGQSISDGTATFSFADASGNVALSYSGAVADRDVKFSLSAHGASTLSASAGAGGPSLLERLGSYTAKGSLSRFSFGTVSLDSWPFEASADPVSIQIQGGGSGEVRLKYSAGGSLSASLRAPFPVRAEVSGLFDGKSIDLSVQGMEFDLGLLAPLMPSDLIKIVSGKAKGGFRAVGLANDPEISGSIMLEDASLKVLGWLADDVGPFKAPILASGRKVSISVPSVGVGKAAVALDCQAIFDHWLPSGLVASVRTLERSRVSLDASLLGISASGDAAADLRFALQGDVLSLDCDVTLDKGSIVVSPAVLAQKAKGLEKPQLFLAVAANVRFGRGVQVFFPSSQFPVIAGYSDPSSLLAIRYDQAADDFTLKGAVALRGGEVFYIQRNFFLKNGRIAFNEGSDRFEPRVTLLAELRDRNDEGPVVITLRADNAPISSFKPRLSSDPPMTESQIALLMGQNLFGASSDNRVDIRKAVISGTEFIPQLNVTRAFENRVRDTFGLDMFYVRTKVLQNFFIDISGQADRTGDTMGRYLDQSELYAGKYLSDSIFAHGSTRIREDPLAGANTLGIDSELGVELDTPFGLIQWNVTPKSWDNLLISDQSLSLSWKLSY